MRRLRHRLVPTLALSLAALLPAAQVRAHSLDFDPGTTYVVQPAMEDYATSGEMMAGLQMSVTQGGVTSSHTWGVLQDDYGTFYRGGVITPDFAIWATGDTWCATFCAKWMVWQHGFQPITQVVFHGPSAGILFDLTTTPADNFGTPGSAKGFTFQVAQTQSYNTVVNAVYRDQVSVGGAPVVGDLWATLELNFAGDGLFSYMQFAADTDQIPADATIAPAVPEPATLALMTAGLGCVLWRRRARSAPRD